MADVKIGLGSFVETDVASAATCDIGAATTLKVRITGTTTITSFGISAGRIRYIRFADALTLTHNAISLILPTGADIVTEAGDTAIAWSGAGGNWLVAFYQRKSGSALAGAPLDPDLADIANATPVNDDILQRKSGAWVPRTMAQLLADLGIAANYQPLDPDLSDIANAIPINDDVLQRKSGAWVPRTMAQLLVDVGAEKLGVLAGVNTQTASYTLVLTDIGKVVEMNVAGANNLTVPLNSSVAFAVGSRIDISQIGSGQTTVVATGGVTIRQRESKLKLAGQYAGASLYKRATDEWLLFGDLSA